MKTLVTILEAVRHPSDFLIYSYVEEGIPVHTGPSWSIPTIETAISKGPHASSCTPEILGFIRGEMQRRIQEGFNILLPVTDVVQVFGANIKLSHITAVPQAHPLPCLILNLLGKLDKGTPRVNYTTDKEVVL